MSEASTVTALEPELRQLEPVLFRFALRATRDAEVARDLTQDALLAGVTQLATFAARSSLRTWLIGILSHKIMDHFRRARRFVDGGDDPDLLVSPAEENIERVLIARQQLAIVDRALAALPERERVALLLADVEGMSREETCHVLGVNATHLRVLLHRARNRLRRRLEAEEKRDDD